MYYFLPIFWKTKVCWYHFLFVFLGIKVERRGGKHTLHSFVQGVDPLDSYWHSLFLLTEDESKSYYVMEQLEEGAPVKLMVETLYKRK